MKRQYPVLAVSAFAIIFGGLTLWSGGAVLFVDGAARIDAGSYVPFVLWFNFLTGFALIAVGAGILQRRQWVVRFSLTLSLASILVFVALGLLILSGVEYETRTIVAMTLRTAIWLGIAGFVRRYLNVGGKAP
jgi:hypothetical protein